jgi:hypothetical protein
LRGGGTGSRHRGALMSRRLSSELRFLTSPVPYVWLVTVAIRVSAVLASVGAGTVGLPYRLLVIPVVAPSEPCATYTSLARFARRVGFHEAPVGVTLRPLGSPP